MSLRSLRDDFVALAVSYVGCGAGPGRDRYLELIADGETPERAAELARESGCGLVVRGLLRELGLDDARLRAPYRDGRVIEDLVAMAREANAWATHYYEIAPGDVLLWASPEHVSVVESSAIGVVHTIDGGQRDAAGLETITRNERALDGARPVVGRIDLEALAARFMVTA